MLEICSTYLIINYIISNMPKINIGEKIMENKQLIIICICIIIGACIIAGACYYGLNNPTSNNITPSNNTNNNTTVIANNTTINTTNNTGESNSNVEESNDDYVYSAQRDGYVKKSGQYDADSQGNTIYSYQGGDGVLYERYYDSDGNEISSEEYYM